MSVDRVEGLKEQYVEYLFELFKKALALNPVDTIYTLLRVGGIQGEHWDPFEELVSAFEDYNWLLNQARAERPNKAVVRVALLMYCQASEMTVPHEILMNLLRILGKEHYHIQPFGYLRRPIKKMPFTYIPPSATKKFNEIKDKAVAVGEARLKDIIEGFYNDNLRNSFSHSDYVMSEEYFRWTETGIAQQIELTRLSEMIDNCFAFYGAFLFCQREWRQYLAKFKQYHKWPNYEVFELLSNQEIGLYGFNVHFSNGTKATYKRTPKGTDAVNLIVAPVV